MIKVYSIKSCPFCQELKEYLNLANIKFVDVDVDLVENYEEYNKLNKFTNCDELPMVRVKNKILIPNKSYKTILEAFNTIKKLMEEDS